MLSVIYCLASVIKLFRDALLKKKRRVFEGNIVSNAIILHYLRYSFLFKNEEAKKKKINKNFSSNTN